MYRRRQRTTSSLFTVILIGVIIGLGYFFLNRPDSSAPVSPVSSATAPSTSQAFVAASAIPSLIPTFEPQAQLFIPAVGVNTRVVDTYINGGSWDVAQLGNNAGHLQGTAWFGQPGNIGLAGHVELGDGSAGIFARIDQLLQGDPVILMLGTQQQRYTVTTVEKVKPDDVSILYPTNKDQVTLITCNSYNFLQNTYEERVVVIAERAA